MRRSDSGGGRPRGGGRRGGAPAVGAISGAGRGTGSPGWPTAATSSSSASTIARRHCSSRSEPLPWRSSMARVAGWPPYALRDDELELTVAALQAAGSSIGPVTYGSRTRDDGELVEWWTAFPASPLGSDRPPVPDPARLCRRRMGPRGARRACRLRHPIGSPVILSRLDVAAADPPSTAAMLHAEIGLDVWAVADLAVAPVGQAARYASFPAVRWPSRRWSLWCRPGYASVCRAAGPALRRRARHHAGSGRRYGRRAVLATPAAPRRWDRGPRWLGRRVGFGRAALAVHAHATSPAPTMATTIPAYG